MSTDTEAPSNPLLFWKEVEKRNSAVNNETPISPLSSQVSSSKLKINFPPPAEHQEKQLEKIDSGSIYGAFNFWKTRDVEIVKQSQDEEGRKRPIIAPPKMPKPTDEVLLQKPPIQAVRLRFLQKSKSSDSITTPKSFDTDRKARSTLSQVKEEEVANKENTDANIAAQANGASSPNEQHDDKSDTGSLSDSENVFEVLQEVLEGVLEGDNVTSLVQKAAQKVKFRDEAGDLYGGIVINDDKPPRSWDDAEFGVLEEDGKGEPKGNGDKSEKADVKSDAIEVHVNGAKSDDEGDRKPESVEASSARDSTDSTPAVEEPQHDDKRPSIHIEPPVDESRSPEEPSSPLESPRSPRDSGPESPRNEGSLSDIEEEPTPGEPSTEPDNPTKPAEGSSQPASTSHSATPVVVSPPTTIDPSVPPAHMSPRLLEPHPTAQLIHQAAAAAVGFIAMDQIDESIVPNKGGESNSTSGTSGKAKKGSKIMKRAGQISKFITMRGDKGDKDPESKEQKEREKEHKHLEKEKEKEIKEKEKEKEREQKEKERELKEKEKEQKKEEKEKEKDKDHRGDKKRKGSSIFVKRDKKVPAISIDTSLPGVSSSNISPVSPPLSPRSYPEGQTFDVELDYLPFDEATGVPKFVASAVQILTVSEFEDVDYLYFDSETNPKIEPLKTLFDTEPLDPSKSYEHVLIAGLLKVFFIELPLPIVPYRLYHNFVDLQEIGEPAVYMGFLRSMIWALPIKHRILLQFLMKFLRDKYLKNPANSKEYVMNKLGAAFGPILIRSEDAHQHTGVALSSAICRSIITNYESLFENFDTKEAVYSVRNHSLVLAQGTQERYLDRLLDPNYNEPEFLQMFLTIYPIILTHNGLIDLLHGLYISNTQNKTKGNKPWKLAMGNRILEVAKQWLEFTYFELREDKALLSRVLRDFPQLEPAYKTQHSASGNSKGHLSFLNNLGARARAGLSTTNVPILETSTVELAQHLTMVDFDLFCAVKPIEWLKYTEPFSSPDKKFPHLYAFQSHHSLWEYWTATEILREPHVGLRVMRVAHFIKVALICREMNNHCTALAIVAGLLHPGIRRLDGTWQILAKDMRDIFENLAEWHKTETERSIDEIVTLLQQTKRPFLPSPITLHRLISLLNTLHPLHPTKAPNMLDLDRLRIIYSMMRGFHTIVTNSYAMKAVPRLYMQLQEVSVLSGDQLMYQSMKCEPPESAPAGIPSSASTNSTASAGLLMTSTTGYKVPEASNNWKAEVKRIWNKPVEQLPIGIDLPRLATSIFVPSLAGAPALVQPSAAAAEPAAPAAESAASETATPASESATPAPESATPASESAEIKPAEDVVAAPVANGDVPMEVVPVPTAEPAATAAASTEAAHPAAMEEVDTRAREVLHSLTNIARFVEGDEYAQNLVQNFGNFVVIDGAKDRDMSREITKLVGEYLGKESKVVKVLKACNQAIIAPAVIELTLNGGKVPFKDAGGWRMELNKDPDGGLITVTHIKQQKSRSSKKEEEFAFEWHLEIIFDEHMNGLSELFLSIPKLNFGPSVSQTTMEGIQYTFAPYLVRR